MYIVLIFREDNTRWIISVWFRVNPFNEEIEDYIVKLNHFSNYTVLIFRTTSFTLARLAPACLTNFRLYSAIF